MKKFSFDFNFAEFIGFGIAWQRGRVALIIPFVMLELSWTS